MSTLARIRYASNGSVSLALSLNRFVDDDAYTTNRIPSLCQLKKTGAMNAPALKVCKKMRNADSHF